MAQLRHGLVGFLTKYMWGKSKVRPPAAPVPGLDAERLASSVQAEANRAVAIARRVMVNPRHRRGLASAWRGRLRAERTICRKL